MKYLQQYLPRNSNKNVIKYIFLFRERHSNEYTILFIFTIINSLFHKFRLMGQKVQVILCYNLNVMKNSSHEWRRIKDRFV